MQEWSLSVWVVAGVLGAIVLAVGSTGVLLAVAVRRLRSRTADELAMARAEAAVLRRHLDDLERRVGNPTPVEDQEFVITRLGDHSERSSTLSAPAVSGPLFVDLVLRESVVQAASLATGLRRALAPEMRNRIRFEMRREVKRARKQRRADLRQARREWEARQRAAADPGPDAEAEDNAA